MESCEELTIFIFPSSEFDNNFRGTRQKYKSHLVMVDDIHGIHNINIYILYVSDHQFEPLWIEIFPRPFSTPFLH